MNKYDDTVLPTIKKIAESYRGKGAERGQLASMACAIAGLPDVRRMVCSFNDRVLYPERPALLLHDDHPAVYLLGWREGDWTDIHDHGRCQVAVHVIQGTVTEDVYGSVPAEGGKDRQIIVNFNRHLKAGDCVTCPRNYIHRVGNMFPEVAATLHVYGPTLDDMNLYGLDEAVLRFKEHWHAEANPQH